MLGAHELPRSKLRGIKTKDNRKSVRPKGRGIGPEEIEGKLAIVEAAVTPTARSVGLSGRPTLQGDFGMLFVLPADQPVCVWMRDTRFPIAAAFISAAGEIVELVELAAYSTEIVSAKVSVRYLLEMPANWFARNKVFPPAHVGGLQYPPMAVE